ncbi:MAG: riboflavin synthase [Actinomycetota bacterium]
MFTGIVIARGKVNRVREHGGVLELVIEARDVARELTKGDSVAVNGVCLTATRTSRKTFTTQAMEETIARTTIGRLHRGEVVNLELPARLADRLGGHLVQGHVDGVARVVRTQEEDGSRRLWLSGDEDVLRYLVSKGSVALDGVSLTVADVGRTSFQVAIIPHTMEVTNLGEIDVDDKLNVEVDVVAKYVERFVEGR